MEIAEMSTVGLVQKVTEPFRTPHDPSTILGIGDDAAVLRPSATAHTLVSTELLMEGIHFDLVYFPLRYLGFKAITAGVSDLIAMGGTPHQVLVSLGLSGRFQVEDVTAIMDGVREACELYRVDLVGGDTTSSLTGLAIGVTAIGTVPEGDAVLRSTARKDDLICVTGDLGAAYMGLQLLVREKRAYDGTPDFQPEFAGREYILQRQMKPIARLDILRLFAEVGLHPTAMIDITDGLAGDLLRICKSSDVGCRIFEKRIPIDHETVGMASDFGLDPTLCALNGGEDYELLFTAPLTAKELLDTLPGISQIGFVTDAADGYRLVSSGGSETDITAQGFSKQSS